MDQVAVLDKMYWRRRRTLETSVVVALATFGAFPLSADEEKMEIGGDSVEEQATLL
jgi:hypothetical protein